MELTDQSPCPACGKPFEFDKRVLYLIRHSTDPEPLKAISECCGRVWRLSPLIKVKVEPF